MRQGEELHRLVRAVGQQLESLKAWGVKELPLGHSVHAHGTKSEALSRLEREVIRCQRCPLYRTRTHHVFGEGHPDAKLLFVGEAPGREEDLQGRPFVGAAGQLLTKMIEAIGLSREQVYICNILKDRPPHNRTPLPDEVEACAPFLIRQLAIIQPKVICTLGAIAAKALLGAEVSISQIRGRVHRYRVGEEVLDGRTPTDVEVREIPVIPTFHPAYLLRNPSAKRLVWQDLKRVKALLEGKR